jgi:uncharacterized protein
MARLLLIVIVVLVGVWWLLGRGGRTIKGDGRPGPARGRGAEEMVQCAHCGVHLPRGDAVMDGALAYCGNAHRAAGPRAR